MVLDKKIPDSAPFNMAIATLMRLDAILTDIKNIAMEGLSKSSKINMQESQRIKFNLVKQFFIQSIPLLKKEQINSLKEKLNNITFPELENNNLVNYKKQKIANSYNPTMDKKMNNFIINVQLKLQEAGNYFMPPKNDPRFGWKEN